MWVDAHHINEPGDERIDIADPEIEDGGSGLFVVDANRPRLIPSPAETSSRRRRDRRRAGEPDAALQAKLDAVIDSSRATRGRWTWRKRIRRRRSRHTQR
jgi:hypothetical protein